MIRLEIYQGGAHRDAGAGVAATVTKGCGNVRACAKRSKAFVNVSPARKGTFDRSGRDVFTEAERRDRTEGG